MNIQDLIARWGGQSPAPIATRASQQMPFWISLLAVILIGYYLARLVWLVYPAATVVWQPPPPPARTNAPAAGPDDYRGLIATHLFGEVSTQPVNAAGDAALNAPDTSLSLQLRGAVAADNPKFAHAIIADGGGNERIYFLNSSVPGGATLMRVEPDRVVLSRGGVLEVLRLPRASPDSAAPLVSSPGVGTIAPNVQQLVAKNAAGFLDVVRPQPFMPNGELKGYRIYPGPNRQQFSAMGLRPGDLVTEINGVALNNPTLGMDVFRTLGDTGQVVVTVERDGQPQVLSLNMAQISPQPSTPGGATQ